MKMFFIIWAICGYSWITWLLYKNYLPERRLVLNIGQIFLMAIFGGIFGGVGLITQLVMFVCDWVYEILHTEIVIK